MDEIALELLRVARVLVAGDWVRDDRGDWNLGVWSVRRRRGFLPYLVFKDGKPYTAYPDNKSEVDRWATFKTVGEAKAFVEKVAG